MRDTLASLIHSNQQNRRTAQRHTAVLLFLSFLTVVAVSWRLHQVGTAMTANTEYYCGYEAHTHTDECYTEELICGYEEGQPEQLDPAFGVDPEPADSEAEGDADSPAESTASGIALYSSSDAASAVSDAGSLIVSRPELHHHTAACYKKVLTCTLPGLHRRP